MSSFGAGFIVVALAGAFVWPVVQAIGTVLLAGGAIVAAAGAAIGAGRAIYHAVKANEGRRIQKTRRDMEAVKGELGDMARSRLDKLKESEERMRAGYERAIEEREKELKSSYEELTASREKLSEVAEKLPAFFEKKSESIEKNVEREITSLTAEFNETCSRMMEDISASMEKKKNEAVATLDRAAEALTDRRQHFLDYAMAAKMNADALLRTVEENYDCRQFAPGELAAARETAAKIDELLRAGDEASVRFAATMAASYEERVLVLEVRAEQNTARFMQEKAVLEARAAELQKMTEATRKLEHDKDETLDKFITEDMNASFWSEGRLDRIWEEAEKLIEKAKNYSPESGQNPAVLASEMDRVLLRMEREHARVREFILSRIAVFKLMRDMIKAMREEGFKLTADPAFELNGMGEEDPRLPVRLNFEKNGDRETVILYDEYDESIGHYKQNIHRFCEEAGPVSEEVRQERDRFVSERIGVNISCDRSTAGMKNSGDKITL